MPAEVEHDLFLFTLIQQGDRLALNTLFARYYHNLCVFANTYLRNAEEAEEAVSDVFVTIWKTRKELKIDRNLKSYLYISVKNAALSTIRKRQPVFANVEDFLFETNLLDTHDPQQLLELMELESLLEKAIATLPPRCQQIFLMSRMESLSYKEISIIIGVAEKTVENQIVKALNLIRDYVKTERPKSRHISVTKA